MISWQRGLFSWTHWDSSCFRIISDLLKGGRFSFSSVWEYLETPACSLFFGFAVHRGYYRCFWSSISPKVGNRRNRRSGGSSNIRLCGTPGSFTLVLNWYSPEVTSIWKDSVVTSTSGYASTVMFFLGPCPGRLEDLAFCFEKFLFIVREIPFESGSKTRCNSANKSNLKVCLGVTNTGGRRWEVSASLSDSTRKKR